MSTNKSIIYFLTFQWRIVLKQRFVVKGFNTWQIVGNHRPTCYNIETKFVIGEVNWKSVLCIFIESLRKFTQLKHNILFKQMTGVSFLSAPSWSSKTSMNKKKKTKKWEQRLLVVLKLSDRKNYTGSQNKASQ